MNEANEWRPGGRDGRKKRNGKKSCQEMDWVRSYQEIGEGVSIKKEGEGRKAKVLTMKEEHDEKAEISKVWKIRI